MNIFNFFKKHKCKICGRAFNKIENYMHHQLICHTEGSSYDCSNCGQQFSDMDKLKDHIRRDHSYKK